MNITFKAAMGAAFGLALSAVGFPFTTWQFWLLLVLFYANGALCGGRA